MQVRLWHENSPLASVVNLCHNAVTHNIPCNLHFFVNSVDFIGRVLHHARLSPDEVKIVCSTSGTSEQINREKLGGDYSIGIPDKAVRKINFYTSTAFEGCDIYDKQGKIYVVSDGTTSPAGRFHDDTADCRTHTRYALQRDNAHLLDGTIRRGHHLSAIQSRNGKRIG